MAGFLRKEFASLIRLQIYDIAIAVFEYFANFFQKIFFSRCGGRSHFQSLVICHFQFLVAFLRH